MTDEKKEEKVEELKDTPLEVQVAELRTELAKVNDTLDAMSQQLQMASRGLFLLIAKAQGLPQLPPQLRDKTVCQNVPGQFLVFFKETTPNLIITPPGIHRNGAV
jgi:hypothetical protein